MNFLLENEETRRLRFKKVDPSDFDKWLDFFLDPASFVHWKGHLQSPEIECKKWFQRQKERYENNEGGMNSLIEKNSGTLVGYSGLLCQMVDGNIEIEIAYSLLPTYRKYGFTTEAALKCRDFAFENNIAESVISIVSLTNTRSAKVAMKNGMKIEKQTVYKDNPVNIFRLHKADWTKSRGE